MKQSTKRKIKRVQPRDITTTSNIEIGFSWQPCGTRLRSAIICIAGSAAKIPSVSNAKILTIQKARAISLAKNSQIPQFRSQLLNELFKMRATVRTNPDHQAYFAALTVLYEKKLIQQGIAPPSFLDTKKDRLLVLLLLADSCMACDSHNLPKGICDWIQQRGIVRNDRHLECFPVPKSLLMLPGVKTATTTILIVETGAVARPLAELVSHAMVNALENSSWKKNINRPLEAA